MFTLFSNIAFSLLLTELIKNFIGDRFPPGNDQPNTMHIQSKLFFQANKKTTHTVKNINNNWKSSPNSRQKFTMLYFSNVLEAFTSIFFIPHPVPYEQKLCSKVSLFKSVEDANNFESVHIVAVELWSSTIYLKKYFYSTFLFFCSYDKEVLGKTASGENSNSQNFLRK